MITNRSNHIPRLMKMLRMNSQPGLRRSFCENSDSGKITLHVSMIHAAHHHCPNTRFQKYICSYWLAEYHATQNSMRYAHPTTMLVNRQSFAAASRWLTVT